jgi:hypothetical protein
MSKAWTQLVVPANRSFGNCVSLQMDGPGDVSSDDGSAGAASEDDEDFDLDDEDDSPKKKKGKGKKQPKAEGGA